MSWKIWTSIYSSHTQSLEATALQQQQSRNAESFLSLQKRKQRGGITLKVKTETIIRTIVLILALANQVLAIYGKEKIPITEEEVYQLISLVVTISSALWAWWKNNSFTLPALKADEYMERLRKEQ